MVTVKVTMMVTMMVKMTVTKMATVATVMTKPMSMTLECSRLLRTRAVGGWAGGRSGPGGARCALGEPRAAAR